jgi:hypothetical protein
MRDDPSQPTWMILWHMRDDPSQPTWMILWHMRDDPSQHTWMILWYMRDDLSDPHWVQLVHNAVLFDFLHRHNFRALLESRQIIKLSIYKTLLFGDSQRDKTQYIVLSRAVQIFIKNSRRFNEGTFSLSAIIFFLYYKCLYLLSAMLSFIHMFIWHRRKLDILFNPYDNKIC